MKVMVVSKTGVITPDPQGRTFDNSSEFEADMKNNPDKYRSYAYTLWDAYAELTCDWEPTTDPLDLVEGVNANNEIGNKDDN